MVIFFPEIRQHDRMHMCVHEAGDHTFSLKVRDRSVKIRELCPQPGPENSDVNMFPFMNKCVSDIMSSHSFISVFVTLFNFLVVSGSGKAVIVMPILQPLGNILHINQQVLVLAYQYGDGITNSFWPGSSLVQLSMCGVDYGTWIRFCWKIYLSLIGSAFVLVMIAYGIGYGPF